MISARLSFWEIEWVGENKSIERVTWEWEIMIRASRSGSEAVRVYMSIYILASIRSG